MRNALITLLITATLAACTPAQQGPKRTLGSAPVTDGGTFSTGGGLSVAAELRQMNGMTALCGVWAESKRQSVLSKGMSSRVVRTGSVYLGDRVLHRDLGFMAKVPPANDFSGAEANCVVTATPWQAAHPRLKVRIPRQALQRENSDADGMSVEVVFRQTGAGAMAPALKTLIFGE